MVYDLSYDGLLYQVDLDGVLVRLHNKGERREAYIPSGIPSDNDFIQIKAIGNRCFCGWFSKITISDSIDYVCDGAFERARVSIVSWSKNCKRIPQYCFEDCSIEKILNIENVTEVGSYAFYMSGIQKITWPDACSHIPYMCFGNSCLKSISNIDDVATIGTGAFSGCNIQKIKWPTNCKEIPMNCFRRSELREITNIDNVAEVGLKAFASSRVKHLDLSNICAVNIEPGAFEGIDPNEITFPYYFPEDVIKLAFEAEE